MSKENVIREAYINLFDEATDEEKEFRFNGIKNFIDDYGWLSGNIHNADESLIEYSGHEMRPKSLQGIEEYYSFVDIVGYEGCYEVNKLGQVKSIQRVSIQKNGKNYTVKEKVFKPQMDNGYIVFGLRKNGKTIKNYLHRIISEAFIPNPENKPCVNHINGVKHDNRIENLEWATYQENNIHAFETGLQKKGEEHHFYGKKGADCHNHKDYNRGWIKIDSEADLPKENTPCWFVTYNEMFSGYYNSDFKNFNISTILFKATETTHYQPIVKPQPPIF